MLKNEASQKVAAQMITIASGAAFTGSVTAYYAGDGGTQTLIGAATHLGNGVHVVTLSAAQTNFDHIAFTFVGTGAITSTVQVYPLPLSLQDLYDAANAALLNGPVAYIDVDPLESTLTVTSESVTLAVTDEDVTVTCGN